MPISRVAALWGFEGRQEPVRRRSSGLRDDVSRWRAKPAAAQWVQEAILVRIMERFAERDHGRSRQHRWVICRRESSVDWRDVDHVVADELGGARMC
jgi:hypothetical protein